MSKADEINAYLAEKFQPNDQTLVVEMLHAVVDKYNYVSDCAAVCIA